MEECFCDLIYNFPWNTFWTALGTIATAVIAWMAYQIEKYKKQDFLYEHRLNAYVSFIEALKQFLARVGTVRNLEELKKIYIKLSICKSQIFIIYDDPKIKEKIEDTTKEAFSIIENYDVMKTMQIKQIKDDKRQEQWKEAYLQQNKSIEQLENCFIKDELGKLFAEYLTKK